MSAKISYTPPFIYLLNTCRLNLSLMSKFKAGGTLYRIYENEIHYISRIKYLQGNIGNTGIKLPY
jgi:hypothetical protein